MGASGGNRIGVSPGTGSVAASASTGGIFIEQTAGNLLTSKYALSSAGAGQTISLATTNGSIAVDSVSGCNANTANDNYFLTTAGTAKDIAFTGGVNFTAAALNLAGSGNTTFNA